jgi:hypothetical protein
MDLLEPNLKTLDIDIEYRGVEQRLNNSETCFDLVDARLQRVDRHPNLWQPCRVEPSAGWFVRRKH